MLSLGNRALAKRFLSWTGIKLLYARITLTRYTTTYFFFAVITCVLLSSLQGITFAENSAAVRVINGHLARSPALRGVPLFEDGVLQLCSSIPGQAVTNCTTMITIETGTPNLRLGPRDHAHDSYEKALPQIAPAVVVDLTQNEACNASFMWLGELLKDARREDIATFAFHIWLFSLALVTVLNESIPHLGAAFFGHLLGAAWATYRLISTYHLKNDYRRIIVPQACGGVDVLGNWWDLRAQHAIAILVVNVLTMIAFLWFSVKLFRAYSMESFSRVGASEAVHRIYKLVLLFSVSLQLCGFFSLASTSMWIDKITNGTMKDFARHATLYLVAFIVTLVAHFPYLILGWVCVRKECRFGFGVFCFISLFIFALSTALFFSEIYRFTFETWPFFAVVTVTAYVLITVTFGLGFVCRLNYGKGLKHFLWLTDELDGADFTPVSFSMKGVEEQDAKILDFRSFAPRAPSAVIVNEKPTVGRKSRGPSVYSRDSVSPIILSSSPPLVSDLGPRPRRLSKAQSHRSVGSKRSFGSISEAPRPPVPSRPDFPPGLSRPQLVAITIPESGGERPTFSTPVTVLTTSPERISPGVLPPVPAAATLASRTMSSGTKRMLTPSPTPGTRF